MIFIGKMPFQKKLEVYRKTSELVKFMTLRMRVPEGGGIPCIVRIATMKSQRSPIQEL